MKASHFVRAFEQEVDRWERQLSVVLEVTEMVLTVQRQWIYLEVMQSWEKCETGDSAIHRHLQTPLFSIPPEHFPGERHTGAAAQRVQGV